MHLVRHSHFPSRDKDGGHTIGTAIPENPMLHANLISFIEPEFMGGGSIHCGISNFFTFFCSCDLDLDPMTFIYKLDSYFREIHRMYKYELPTPRLSKVIVSQTYR